MKQLNEIEINETNLQLERIYQYLSNLGIRNLRDKRVVENLKKIRGLLRGLYNY